MLHAPQNLRRHPLTAQSLQQPEEPAGKFDAQRRLVCSGKALDGQAEPDPGAKIVPCPKWCRAFPIFTHSHAVLALP